MQMKDSKYTKFIIIGMVLISILGIAQSVVLIALLEEIWSGDLYTYWTGFAYTIRGYSQADVISNNIVIESIGPLDRTIILPWSTIIGNIICPGFLPYNAAKIYYYFLLVVSTVILGILLFDWIKKHEIFIENKNIIIATICICTMPWSWFDEVNTANIGGLLCIWILIAILIYKKYPIISILLISISFVKPQIGALFLLIFIFERRIKSLLGVVFVNITAIIAGYVYEYIMRIKRGINISASGSPLNMLMRYVIKQDDVVSAETNPYWHYGIFDPLRQFGISNTIVLILSALLGVVFVTYYWRIIHKSVLNKDIFLLFSPAIVASIFWFYKSPCDNIILIGSNLLILYSLKRNNSNMKFVVLSLLLFILNNIKICKYGLRFVIPLLSYSYGVVGDMILQIIVYCVTIRLILYEEKTDKEAVFNYE